MLVCAVSNLVLASFPPEFYQPISPNFSPFPLHFLFTPSSTEQTDVLPSPDSPRHLPPKFLRCIVGNAIHSVISQSLGVPSRLLAPNKAVSKTETVFDPTFEAIATLTTYRLSVFYSPQRPTRLTVNIDTKTPLDHSSMLQRQSSFPLF